MNIPLRYLPLAGACLAMTATASLDAQAYDNSPAAKLVDKLLGGPRWGSVATFDVAGVTLGMTPDEARAVLRKARFVPASDDPAQDAWSAVVSQRVAGRIGGTVDQTKVPMFTRAKGAQGETVEVWYAATQDGAHVTEVKYRMPTARMDRTEFMKATLAKYGRPTVQEGLRSIYCTKLEKICASYENKALPYLVVEPDYNLFVIDLMMGQRYQDERKASLSAAIETAAPKNAKASF